MSTKHPLQSTTIWGGIIALLGGIAASAPTFMPIFGFTPDQTGKVIAAIGAITTVWGGIQAIIGRFNATTAIKS